MKEGNENKMGVMPVKKLLITMSLPMMISMLVQALYNVVDSYFVAQISEDALTAVTLAFPVQNLMIAIASGTAVGVNALLSKSLGEKNFKRANQTANAGVLLSFLSFLLLLAYGLLQTRSFVLSQTDVKHIVDLGVSYLRICCCCSIGLFLQVMGERLLQSTGKTIFSMVSQLTGAIINIILDPILIFGMFGLPRMEVAGAALATVIGQCCAGVLSLILNKAVNKDIQLSMKEILHPNWNVIKRIYIVGVPSILMMSIGSAMTYAMNKILLSFSTTAAAVFGIYFKLQSFFFMPVFGLNNGLIPILAYNFGARKPERIKEALRFALFMALGVMVTGMMIMKLFPEQLLDIFNASDTMKSIGVPALKTISYNFPIAAVCIALISTFQAFSKSIYSLIVSIMRQLVVLIPVAWLLSKTGEVTNVWWAFPAAELTGLIVTVYLFKTKIYDKIIVKL